VGAKSFGFKELAADLGRAHDEIIDRGKRIVGQGCLNIKRDAQRIIRAASPRGYLKHYPRSINYDVTATSGTIRGEVGPDKSKVGMQGGLGPYIEDGTIHNAPIPHMVPALEAETPRFERYVAELGEDLIAGQKPPEGGPVQDPEP
jgi:hypothetical protein